MTVILLLRLTHPTLLAGTSAAPLTSGSPTAPQVSPIPGTSPSAVPSAPPSGPEPTGTQARCSSMWSLASPSSTTPRPVVPAWGSSSDPLSSRPSEVVGLAASASCPAGSPASLAVPPPSPPPTPASLSLSAPQQTFTWKTRGRSSSAPLMISHPRPVQPWPPGPRRGSRLDDHSFILAASHHSFSFLFSLASLSRFLPPSLPFLFSAFSPLPFPGSPPSSLPVSPCGLLARCSVSIFWEEEGPRVHSVMVAAYSWHF